MNDFETLTRLVNLQTFKTDDKKTLLPYLERFGIDKPTKTNCGSCWRDAAIMALRELKREQPADNSLPVLRGDAGNVGVIWRGRLVNNDTMTAELAQWLIETDFPESLYEKK